MSEKRSTNKARRKPCEYCGVEIHPLANHTGNERWCEDCFEKGLHKDMSDHFDNYMRQELELAGQSE